MERSDDLPHIRGPRLCLFGGLSLSYGEGNLIEFPTRRARLILAILAVGPDKGVHRESLSSTLWPDVDPEQGKRRLSTEIWRLRLTLKQADTDAWLVDRDGRIALNAAARSATDVIAFETAIVAARTAGSDATRLAAVAEAERLYVGPFMPGETDEWCLARRAFYEVQRMDLLEFGLGIAMQANAHDEVIRLGETLLVIDPFAESAARAVMHSHVSLGHRGVALAVFDRLAKSLRDELGVAPAPETLTLRYELVSARAPAVAAAPLKDRAPRPIVDAAALRRLPIDMRSMADAIEKLARDITPAVKPDARRGRDVSKP